MADPVNSLARCARKSVNHRFLFFIHPSAMGSLTHRFRRHHRKATISLQQLVERDRQVADTDARRVIHGISDGSGGTKQPPPAQPPCPPPGCLRDLPPPPM